MSEKLYDHLVELINDEDCVGILVTSVKRQGEGLSTDINEFTNSGTTEMEKVFVGVLADLFYEAQSEAIDNAEEKTGKGDTLWN